MNFIESINSGIFLPSILYCIPLNSSKRFFMWLLLVLCKPSPCRFIPCIVESEIMNVLFRVLCYEEKEIGITYRRKALTQITKIEHILGLDHTMQGINLHGDGLHSTRRSHIKNLLEEFSGIQYKIDGRKMPELIDSIKFIDEIKEEGMIFRDSGIALIILALKYFTRNTIYSSKMLTEILV